LTPNNCAATRLALLSAALPASSGAIAKDKDPEHDPGQIGDRDVGKGVNFYSIGRSAWVKRWPRRRNARPRW
jgi:hypothetical protein